MSIKNSQALGLACFATLTSSAAYGAIETDLQQSDEGRGDLTASVELLNLHTSQGITRHNGVTANPHLAGRYYDVGLTLDAYMALDGDDTEVPAVGSFELTEVNIRLDYLFEITGYVQILPFLEVTSYPNVTGKAPFHWIGTDIWYMLPWEGLELGASGAYNFHDETNGDNLYKDDHFIGSIGARQFYQDAPLDLAFWQVVNLGSRSYHEYTSGTDKQGVTTLDIGVKATLPLPWEEMWSFLRLEGLWWINGDDKDALKAAGRDSSEVIIGVGVEYHTD